MLTSGVRAGEVDRLKEEVDRSRGLERRRAARKLMALGGDATPAIIELARIDDVIIRRAALRKLRDLLGDEAVPHLQKALDDPSPLVRMVAVEQLITYRPRTDAVTAVLQKATTDADPDVRKLAAGAFWTFHRDVVPLRKRPGWDHAIEVMARKPLPEGGWLFRTDPARVGHVKGWFGDALERDAWHPIAIETFWHEALPEKVGKYEGVGWYRITFDAPEKPEGKINEVVLHFTAVDESTWVWVNGNYAGEHDLGPMGWKTPFDIDIGPFVKWGEPNVIAVRVLNTAGAGGIYKPVEFQVLR
ncbi:MAG: HEAT repeat domain-containing protein [Planctomycetota bacterium]